MNYFIDNKKQEIHFENGNIVPLYSPEGFRIISDIWVKIGWDQKHLYSFTWLGRPIIQIPDDAFRIQEVIYKIKPDVIIETGIAHGGSLIFNASICHAMNKGRVIGIDIEIRPHNRAAIEAHDLFPYISLIEGNAISEDVFNKAAAFVKSTDTVLVVLDSCHTYQHVCEELRLYSRLVTLGSYIVATDGSQEYLNETPRAKREYPDCKGWNIDNPKRAAEDFVANNPKFIIEEPEFAFNEGNINYRITHWPSAFIKRYH